MPSEQKSGSGAPGFSWITFSTRLVWLLGALVLVSQTFELDAPDISDGSLLFWAGTLLVGLAALDAWRAKGTNSREPDADVKTTDNSQVTAQVIRELRQRATRLRMQAGWMFVLLVAAVMAGLIIFVFAVNISRIGGLDLPGEREWRNIKEGTFRKESLEEAIKIIKVMPGVDGKTADTLVDTLNETHHALLDMQETVLRDGRMYADMERKLAAMQVALESRQFDINATLTRLSIAILLLFLVRILLQSYRYNISLAAFYDSRADVLQLRAKDSSGVDQVMLDSLYPKELAFGVIPKSPVEDLLKAADIMTNAVQRVAKNTPIPGGAGVTKGDKGKKKDGDKRMKNDAVGIDKPKSMPKKPSGTGKPS